MMVRRFVISLLGALALGLLLLFTAAALWLALLDPTDRRDDIAAWLSRRLELPVRIQGEVHLSLHPWLGLELGKTSLGDDGDGQPPLALVETVALRVRLEPLLRSGALELDHVVLRDPVVRLRREADGQANWTRVLQRMGDLASAGEGSEPLELAGLRIHPAAWRGVSVINGAVFLDDAVLGEQASLSHLHCNAAAGREFPFVVQLYGRSALLGGEGALSLEGRCTVDLDQGGVQLTDTAVSFTGAAGPPPWLDAGNATSLLPLAFSGLVDLDSLARRGQVRRGLLSTPWLGLALETEILRPGEADGRLEGSLSLAPSTVSHPDVPSLPAGPDGVLLTSSFRLDRQGLHCGNLTLRVAGSDAAGEARADFGAAPRLEASLHARRLDLASLGSLFAAPPGAPFSLPDWLLALPTGGWSWLGPGAFAELALTAEQTLWSGDGAAATDADGQDGPDLTGLAARLRLDRRQIRLDATAPQVKGGEARLTATLEKQGVQASLRLDRLESRAWGWLLAGLGPMEGRSEGKGAPPVLEGPGSLEINATAQGLTMPAWRKSVQASLAATLDKGSLDPSRLLGLSPREQANATRPANPVTFETLRLLLTADPKQDVSLGQVQVNATLTGKGLSWEKSPTGEGTLALQGLVRLAQDTSLPEELQHGRLDVKGRLPKRAAAPGGEFSLSAQLEAHGPRETLAARKIALAAPGLDLSGSLRGTQLRAAPRWDGELALARASLPATLSTLWPLLGFPPPVLPTPADPAALKTVSLRAAWQANATHIRCDSCNATLDDVPITGDVTHRLAPAGRKGEPRWRFSVRMDRLDLDRLLPARTPGQQEAPWDLQWLRTLDCEGKVFIKDFKAYRLDYQDLAATAKAANGALRLDPLDARFHDGHIQASLRLEADKALAMNLSAVLRQFKLEPVIAQFGGGSSMGGRTDMTISLESQGLTREEHLRSLSGKAGVAITNGFYSYEKTVARPETTDSFQPRKPAPPPATRREVLPVPQASASFLIQNGLVRNEDFRMTSERFTATGKGWLNFPDGKVDYAILVDPGLIPAFPITIKGSLDNPHVDDSQGASLAEAVGELSGTVFRTLRDVLTLPFRMLEPLNPIRK